MGPISKKLRNHVTVGVKTSQDEQEKTIGYFSLLDVRPEFAIVTRREVAEAVANQVVENLRIERTDPMVPSQETEVTVDNSTRKPEKQKLTKLGEAGKASSIVGRKTRAKIPMKRCLTETA